MRMRAALGVVAGATLLTGLLASSVSAQVPDLPTDALPTDQLPTDALPTDALPTDQLPTDQLPTDALPTDQLPTDQLPTDQLPELPVVDLGPITECATSSTDEAAVLACVVSAAVDRLAELAAAAPSSSTEPSA